MTICNRIDQMIISYILNVKSVNNNNSSITHHKMKKVQNCSSIVSPINHKKPINHTKQSNLQQTNRIKWFKNIPKNKKQNVIVGNIKMHRQPLIDQKECERLKKNIEKNIIQNKLEEIYDCQNLKNRLNALQDKLIQIKKGYQYRKKKCQHFFYQQKNKNLHQVAHIENNQPSKFIINQNNEFSYPQKYHKQTEHRRQRFTVQSPRSKVLQQLSTNRQQITHQPADNVKQQDIKSHQLISKYVTKYQPKPFAFKHSTSQVNLFNFGKIAKRNIDGTKEKKNYIYYISAVLQAFQTTKPTSFDEICANHVLTSYQFLCYVENLKIDKPVIRPVITLPQPTKKITIIFDLDETLIHCLEVDRGTAADVFLPIKFIDQNQQSEVTVGINVRPYTRECLKQLSKYFEIMVFTASHESYANAIADFLDPNRQLIAYRFSRDHCYKTQQGFYVKDLRVIDRKLEKVLLVDNAALSYCFQPENGIPIVPFYDNKADLQLKNLIGYLKLFLNQQDVRIKNNKIMKLNQYCKFSNVQDLINGLYK